MAAFQRCKARLGGGAAELPARTPTCWGNFDVRIDGGDAALRRGRVLFNLMVLGGDLESDL